MKWIHEIRSHQRKKHDWHATSPSGSPSCFHFSILPPWLFASGGSLLSDFFSCSHAFGNIWRHCCLQQMGTGWLFVRPGMQENIPQYIAPPLRQMSLVMPGLRKLALHTRYHLVCFLHVRCHLLTMVSVRSIQLVACIRSAFVLDAAKFSLKLHMFWYVWSCVQVHVHAGMCEHACVGQMTTLPVIL